jgi:hypothetical protein
MAVRYEQEVNRLFGSEDAARQFLKDIGAYLRDSKTSAELIDAELKAGEWGLTRTALDKVLGAAGHGLLLPLEIYDIRTRYAEEGPSAAAQEILFTLLAHGVPVTAAARLVAELTRALVIEGVRLAGNYFVFDPINASMLDAIFDERDASGSPNAICIYGWPESPLRTFRRETLCCKAPHDAADATRPSMPFLESMANVYVHNLEAWKGFKGVGVFASAGEGDIRKAVLTQLVTDWHSSRILSDSVDSWTLSLNSGIDQPATDPFQVWLDGAPPAPVARAVRRAQAGTPATFMVTLRRELDELLAIYQRNDLHEIWCRNGLAAAQKRVDEYTADYIRQNGGYRAWLDDQLEVNVSIRGGEGWEVESNSPWLPVLAGGDSSSRRTLKMNLASSNRVVIDNHTIRCAPTEHARTDLQITLDLAYTRVSLVPHRKAQPRRCSFRCELTARLQQPPPHPTPVAPPPVSISTEPSPTPTPSTRPTVPPASPPAPGSGETALFDEQCALAAWIADFEARHNRTGHDDGCQWSYRVEWTCRPFMGDGGVMGAFQKIISKRYDDGRVIPPYAEVIDGDASHPAVLATRSELRQMYPRCVRRSGGNGATVSPADGAWAPTGPTVPPEVRPPDPARVLESWKSDLEKPTQGRGDHYSYVTRIEWTCPPFIKDGVVYGAYKRMTSKKYDDGRFVDFYVETEMFDAAHPGILTTVDEIRKQAH